MIALLVAIWSVAAAGESALAADACLSTIKTQLDALSDEMKQVPEVPAGPISGRPVPPGICTRLVSRIQGDFGFYPAYQAEVDRNNTISCLELKRILLRRQCDCAKVGATVSGDNDTIEKSLEASRRLAKAQTEFRKRAIANPLIRKWVDEASKVRDCYSQRTIEILNATSAAVERAIDPPTPSASAERPPTTVQASRIEGGVVPTTVRTSKVDGGVAPTTVRTSRIDGGVPATTVTTSYADGGASSSSSSGGGDGLGSIVNSVIGIAGAALQGYSAGQRSGTVYAPTRVPTRVPTPSYSGQPRRGQSDISGTR